MKVASCSSICYDFAMQIFDDAPESDFSKSAKQREIMQRVVDRYGDRFYGFISSLLNLSQSLSALNGETNRENINDRRQTFVKKILTRSFVQAIRHLDLTQENIYFPSLIMKYLILELKKAPLPSTGKTMFSSSPRLLLIQQALMRLDLKKRLHILMRDQLGFLYPEMAFAFSSSEHTVKDDLKTARDSFRLELDQLMDSKTSHDM